MDTNNAKNKDRVVKHLELIQGIINRLGHNSFLLKGWSMLSLVAGAISIASAETPPAWPALLLLLPVAGFWGLDGYYLWRERLFRAVYDEIRIRTDTSFAMATKDHVNKTGFGFWKAMFSITNFLFYATEASVVATLFFLLYKGSI